MACFVGMKPQLEPTSLRAVQTTPALTPWVRYNHIWTVTLSIQALQTPQITDDSTAGLTSVTCLCCAPEKDSTAQTGGQS